MQSAPTRLAVLVVSMLANISPGGIAKATDPPSSALTAAHLRCEYLENPLAVDVDHPRLSWELQAIDPTSRGLGQADYQIVVKPCTDAGKPSPKELWDSGWVHSSRTNQIEYAGPVLPPGQCVVWQVRVRDNAGGTSAWSKPASWSTGLRTAEPWSGARWIGDPTPPPKDGFEPLPAPMLRRDFSFPKDKRIERAIAYASALGVYELRINGHRIGDHELAPEWTDYTKRVQYQAYDVTDTLRAGDNCIGAILGDGWYAGKIGLTGIVPKGPPRAIYGRQPRLLACLKVFFTDGTGATVVTDGSWRATLEGPIRTADIMDGETYDARREMPGWDEPGFDASAWKPALIAEPPKASLIAQPDEPIRVNREIKPIAITEPHPGVYVVDMGQNMVGWCRIRLVGSTGRPITLRHAEVLNPDGTIYTANLRGAHQTDRCTPASEAEFVFEPRFTYHGFRYVEITGVRVKPALDAIVGRVANSSAPEVGAFECSEPMLNRLWQNILWTQRGNLMGVPTDCPQRDERCGWMGDILAFAPTACFNMDMAAFLTKWVPDTRDAQAADGRFADFSPQPYDPNVRFSGVPAWGDAGVFVPWTAYRFYGDTRILVGQYPAAVRWIEYILAHNPDHLWTHSRGNDYGDWLNADTLKLAGWPATGAEVPKPVFATMFFYRSTQIVADMARILGHDEDARRYAAQADAIREAFNKAYVSPEGVIEGDTQAGYALALQFGLLPEKLQPIAVDRMLARFKPYDGQISTGFHSTLPLMEQLSGRDHNDDAYRLLLNRRMPSWGYEIDHGATTVWERWDGYVEGRGQGGFQDPGMNSFAHYAIGAVGEWMYSTMLGIRPGAPGFETIIIHPHPGPGVRWAQGSYRSIRGPITCRWEQDPREFRLSVHIPPNTTARIVLPAKAAEGVHLDNAPIGNSKDVTHVEPHADGLSLQVGSGAYTFVVRQSQEPE
jgi:alpha-L-rhamnosidase